MKRQIKHHSSVEARSEGPSFVVQVTISNDKDGSVLIRSKDWNYIHNSFSVPLKDVSALIQELQWAVDRCGEME